MWLEQTRLRLGSSGMFRRIDWYVFTGVSKQYGVTTPPATKELVCSAGPMWCFQISQLKNSGLLRNYRLYWYRILYTVQLIPSKHRNREHALSRGFRLLRLQPLALTSLRWRCWCGKGRRCSSLYSAAVAFYTDWFFLSHVSPFAWQCVMALPHWSYSWERFFLIRRSLA